MFHLDYNIYGFEELDSILDQALQNGIHTNTKKISYYNIVCAFDIESSSFTDKVTKEDHNEKRALMYVWQLAINGHVIIGRTWKEFIDVINHIIERLELSKYKRLLIYIHNLSFEMEFFRYLFKWSKVFAINTRKPIYAITESGIEFRCSYLLTNYSLAKLGEQLQKYKVKKAVNDLDYSLIRHSETPLSKKELFYIVCDVLVVSAYIQECIEKERYIYNIPLTCTGYCRRFVRHNCLYAGGKHGWRKQYRKYNALMKSLQITGVEEYEQLKRAFQGGFTHASCYWSGYKVSNVDSIDFTSSYPFCLISEKNFPMSTAIEVKPKTHEEFENYLKCYCCIFDIKFYDLQERIRFEHYLSSSKCYVKKNAIEDNGRVVSADEIATTLTEIDFEICKKFYKWKNIKISNMRIYKKGYLPLEIIQSVIELYKENNVERGGWKRNRIFS